MLRRLLILIILSSLCYTNVVLGKDNVILKYNSGDVSLGEYLSSLRQPDNPLVSCCGPADAYLVKSTEECSIKDLSVNKDCSFVAILDKQPKTFLEHQETKFPEGSKFIVPKYKLRDKPIPNTVGEDIIFLSSDGFTYCYEPTARF